MSKATICPPNTVFDPESYPSNDLLLNPYESHTELVTRFAADLPEEVAAKFKSIMPFRGAIQATLCTLLYGILAEFEKQGINNYDPTYKPQIVKIIKERAFGVQLPPIAHQPIEASKE